MGVIIAVDSLKTGTASDSHGRYTLTVPAGTHTVRFSAAGMQEQKQIVTLSAGEEKTLSVTLRSVSDIPEIKTVNTQTVVVSAGKFEQNIEDVPVSMAVIKPAFIEHTNQTSLDVAVEQVPGVTVIDGQANIRGGSGFSYGAGSRVMVLVDDIPVLAGDANDVKWSFIPVENVGQVEVIKGASSALYGSSALNGIINLRTNIPSDKPETKITAYTGFYDTPENADMKWWDKPRMISGANFAHLRKIRQFDLALGGHYFNDAGYRQGDTEERIRGNINLRYHFKKVTGLTAGIAVNAQYANGGNFLLWQNDTAGAYLPLGGTDPGKGATLSYYKTTRVTFDPSVTYVRAKTSHRFRGRYFLTDNKNNTEQESRAENTYAEYLFQAHINAVFNLSAGVNLITNKVTGDLYGKQSSDDIAGFLQADGSWKIFTYSAGYRAEKATISDDKLDAEQLFRAGLSAKILKATWLRTSYGQGFRFPSIAEKFVKTQVGNIVIYPNDSLQTERGWTFEAGIRQGFRIGKWHAMLDVSYFINEYDNMMEFTFGSYGNPFVDPLFGLGFKSVNIGNTKITGEELSVAGEGLIGKVHQSISAGVTFIDPKQRDYDAKEDTVTSSSHINVLKYRYRTTWKIDEETSWKRYYLGFSARYYSFMENIDKAFQITIPGVQHYRSTHEHGDWIFDARFGVHVTGYLDVSLIAKNVTNHEWSGRPADMQPPRTWTIQAAVKF